MRQTSEKGRYLPIPSIGSRSGPTGHPLAIATPPLLPAANGSTLLDAEQPDAVGVYIAGDFKVKAAMGAKLGIHCVRKRCSYLLFPPSYKKQPQ